MNYKEFLLAFPFLFAACDPGAGEPNYHTVDSELQNEVALTDLYGLNFSFKCVIDGDDKRCEVVFDGFKIGKDPNVVSDQVTMRPTFGKASLLSLQVEDESVGEVQSLITYFQKGIEMKGAVYDSTSRKIKLSGFYKGDEWVEQDSTIVIGNSIRTNDEGVLAFAVSDSRGNRVRYEADLGEVLKNNDVSTLDSTMVSYVDNSDPTKMEVPIIQKPGLFWTADTNAVTIEPEDINFTGLSNPFLYVPVKNLTWPKYMYGTEQFSILVEVKNRE
jgi:hypothetical protein